MFKIPRHGLGAAVCGRIRVFLARIAGPRAPCRRLIDDRSGATAITVALMMTAFLGITGLTLDVGDWYSTRSAMQSAADAAALGGAVAMLENDTQTQITTVATTDAGLNDASGLAKSATINVSVDMINDIVTTTITKPATLLLSGLFLHTAPTISVTAKAGLNNNGGPICALSTDQNATGIYFDVQGNATVTATGCNIVVDSTSTDAINATGGAALVTASSTCGPGGWAGAAGDFSPDPTSCAALPDPLAHLTAPANVNSTCPAANTNVVVKGATVTLQPGVYCGTGGNPAISVQSNGILTLASGIYVLQNGGMANTSNSTVTGNGVALYVAYPDGSSSSSSSAPALAASGSANISLTAMTTAQATTAGDAALAGMLIYQQANALPTGSTSLTNSLGGNGNEQFTGALYFGNQNILVGGNANLAGQSNSASWTAVLANDINITGNGTLNLPNNSSSPIPFPSSLQKQSVTLLQ